MIALPRIVLRRYYPILNCQMLRLMADDATASTLVNLTFFKQLGFSENESIDLSNNKYVKKLDPPKLTKLLDTIQSLGFSKEDALIKHPTVLKLHPYVIENYFMILEESGFYTEKISIEVVQKYLAYSNKTVSYLKQQGFIDETIDVTTKILSHCDLPSHLYPKATDDSQPFRTIQMNATKCYICWLLDVTKEEIDRKSELCNIKHKSIRIIKGNLDVLQNEMEFPKEKIRRFLALLGCNPGNLRNNLEKIPFISSKPLKFVANKYPKMLLRPTDVLLEIIQIVKDFNIDEKALTLYPEMFSLSPDTVRERITILSTDPNYKYLFSNARMLKCVTNFRGLIKRINMLKDSKWNCYSADMLAGGQQNFNVRLKMMPDCYNGKDILHFLQKEMKISQEEIHSKLIQNIHWNHVPLRTISSTLNFLCQAGFSHDQITDALPVVLYPTNKVEECLQGLEASPEVDCCRDPVTGKVKEEFILQLVLYFLERPFHFKGNGVWELDQAPSSPVGPDQMSGGCETS